MCRILRVLEGSGRLNVSYFTCLEVQNVDKYFTFAWFSGWKAPGVKINRILRVWKALGGLKCRILRVWKLKTSKNTSHLFDFSGWNAPGIKIYRILRVWKALGS